MKIQVLVIALFLGTSFAQAEDPNYCFNNSWDSLTCSSGGSYCSSHPSDPGCAAPYSPPPIFTPAPSVSSDPLPGCEMTDSYGHCYRCYSDDEGTHCSPNGEAQPPFDGSSSSDAPTSYREGLRAMRETLRGDDAKALFNFIKDVGVDSVYENGERVRKAFGFGCASGPTVKLDCVIAKNNLDHLTSLSSDDNPKAFKLIEKIIDLIDRQMNSDRIRRTFEQQNAVIFQDVTCSQSRCTMRVIAR